MRAENSFSNMEDQQVIILRNLAIIIVSATVVIRLFSMLKLPLLLGFILVGILLAPVTGIIKDTSGIAAVGELGVMFMMFFVGLEFNLDRLRKVLAPSVLGLAAQIASMSLLGFAAASIMGLGGSNGFLLGAMLAMSSTIVIIEIFTQRKELGKRFAHITVGILIAEDLFAVFLLVILSSLASGHETGFAQLAQSTVLMLTFVITVFVVGKLSIPAILRRFGATKSQQELIMYTFCIILGVGFLADVAHMSLELGAFLAGSIISGTAVSSRIEAITGPFRNLFVAMFFVSVGTMIDPAQVVDAWQPIIWISLGVVTVRSAACFLGILISGEKPSDAFLSAAGKAQIGEFSFVVAGLGVKLGVMDKSMLAIAMGVSLITIFANPFIADKSLAIMNFLERFIPNFAVSAAEKYRKFIVSVSEGARNGKIAAISLPAASAGIYTLLFNAVLLMALFGADMLSGCSEYAPVEVINIVVWMAAAIFSFPIILGIIRNVGQCSRAIVAASEWGRGASSKARVKLNRLLERIFTTVIVAFFSAVYLAFVRNYISDAGLFWFFVGACAVFAFLLWRMFGDMGSELEENFKTVFRRHIENAGEYRHAAMMKSIRENYAWAIDIAEVEIAELALCAGKTVGELAIRKNSGADIAAIRRGRFVVYNIFSETRVFPDDIVVLSGTPQETAKAQKILSEQESDIDRSSVLRSQTGMSVECVGISAESGLAGKTLAEANLTKLCGIKILGILRKGQAKHVRPSAGEKFAEDDSLLIVGPRDSVDAFKRKYCAAARS